MLKLYQISRCSRSERKVTRAENKQVCCFAVSEAAVRILSKTVTILEIENGLGAALASASWRTPADSAAKAKSKFADSRRKKNEEKRKNFKGATSGFNKKLLSVVRLHH